MSESIVLVISGTGGLILVAVMRWWQRLLDREAPAFVPAGPDASRPPPGAERRALVWGSR